MTPTIVAALTGFFVYGSLGGVNGFATSTAQTNSPAEPTYAVYTVSMTGYNAVPEQTDGDPTITASGAYSDPDIIAARSVDLKEELPYGTVISVLPATTTPNCGFRFVEDKIGLRVIGDSMHPRMRNKIDILFDADESIPAQEGKYRNPARALGFCRNVEIVVVGHIDMKHIPKTQTELAAAVELASLALK